jgi:hypothetical protein
MRPSGHYIGAAMTDGGKVIEKARQFAQALDACDYQAAAKYLAADCRYVLTPDGVYVGPDTILAKYRQSDEKARREFDSVEYSNEVSSTASGCAIVTFVDALRKCGAMHTYRCSQIVYFDEDEKINRIEHREIPGERKQLNEFRQSFGSVPI